MKQTIANAGRLLSLTLGRSQSMDAGEMRYVSVARAALASAAARGIGILAAFASVPLTIGYLGDERYGAWVTISTLLTWLLIADLGLGNGLTNAIVEATARGRADLARSHVATAVWLLAGVALVLGAAGVAIWSMVDWSRFLNVHSELARSEVAPALLVALGFFLAGFPLTIIEKIYAAIQRGAAGNLWIAGGNVAGFLAIVAVTSGSGGLVALVVALMGTRLAVSVANAVWFFGWDRPDLRPAVSALRRDSVRLLLGQGTRFFIIQAAVIVIFNTDNVIIARILGAAQVTPYSVAWQLFSLPSMVVALYFPYLWPAYASALAQGEYVWVVRAFGRSLLVAALVSVILTGPLVLWGREILVLWAGPAASPPPFLLAWMGAWAVIACIASTVACLLNAAGQLKGQTIYGPLTALVNLVLSMVFAREYGITGVIAATVIAYFVCAFLPISAETTFYLKRLSPNTR